ncbi:MAG: sulfurtransferase [Chloroflexota bacterium]|nr:sulfurtransferase [Chloroflexota bacterium]
MQYTTLIELEDAAAHLEDEGWLFVDCRFVLGQPQAGRAAYLEAHVPGAVYADLEADLSGQVVPGQTGRHPLPSEADFDATMSRLGVWAGTQVVAYDEQTGAMAAARLWWLLKWAGHDTVAVLDGGFEAWRAAGLPVAAGWQQRPPARFEGRYRPGMAASAEDLLSAASSPPVLLVDARAADRYRGENESMDPVAGHIPGAISLPYPGNLGRDGRFLPADELRARYESATDSADPESTVFYCGSGVTAAHSVLAYAHAGLGVPKLYPGSWSEWITDPARPVETRDS